MQWDTNEHGNITLSPLIDFEARVAEGMACCVRMELAVPPGPPRSEAIAVQVAMTLLQAQRLVLGLQRTIDHILTPPQTPPN